MIGVRMTHEDARRHQCDQYAGINQLLAQVHNKWSSRWNSWFKRLFDFDFHIISSDPNWKALNALPGWWAYDGAALDVESGTVPGAGDLIARYVAL